MFKWKVLLVNSAAFASCCLMMVYGTVAFSAGNTEIPFLGKTPVLRSALCDDFRPPSFVVVHHNNHISPIYREWFDVEQPNFTETSIPTHSTATPDMTSLSVFGRKLSLNSCPKCRFRRLLVEFLQNDLTEDHKSLHAYWGQC